MKPLGSKRLSTLYTNRSEVQIIFHLENIEVLIYLLLQV
jgi:hypothetical protein